MKAIGTVLLVLVAVMGMAMPVLGADSGSTASVYADWLYADQSTYSWADNGVEYADAGTYGEVIFIGDTGSTSGAGASDSGESADAATSGGCDGFVCDTYSEANAADYDTAGITGAGAVSAASGETVQTNGGAGGQNWALPITSGAWASGDVFLGSASSGAGASAYRP